MPLKSVAQTARALAPDANARRANVDPAFTAGAVIAAVEPLDAKARTLAPEPHRLGRARLRLRKRGAGRRARLRPCLVCGREQDQGYKKCEAAENRHAGAPFGNALPYALSITIQPVRRKRRGACASIADETAMQEGRTLSFAAHPV